MLEAIGTDTVIRRYATAVRRLRDAGWLRILAVTDHGYIHWTGSTEKTVPLPTSHHLGRRTRRWRAYSKAW